MRLAVALAVGSGLPACTFVTETDVEGHGIGSACQEDSDCHAAVCSRGMCTAPCSSNLDCPAPTECFARMCEHPLKVAALWEGVVSAGEGWNLTHHEGMQEAAANLPYLRWTYQENISTAEPGVVEAAAEQAIADGAEVVVADSFNQQDEMLSAAERHPDVKFLIGGGSRTNDTNAAWFYAFYEQAAYVAGKVAAMKARKRACFIGALVTPEQVREVNAFALGAQTVNPDIVVEVSWLGFWLDYNEAPQFEYKGENLYREEVLAARMIDSGCEVVAHQSDNQRSVRYIEARSRAGTAGGVWSLAANNRNGYREVTADGPNGPPIRSCLGSVYYNWAPLYLRLFDQIHRHVWEPVPIHEPMSTDVDNTVVGFSLNPNVGVDDSVVRSYLNQVARKGPQFVFEGPYETTGQRDRDNDGAPDAVQTVAAGETLTEDEYHTMCWFVRGVVQKSDPLDPSSSDVPAAVPDAANPAAPDMLGPPGAPPGVGLTCQENI